MTPWTFSPAPPLAGAVGQAWEAALSLCESCRTDMPRSRYATYAILPARAALDDLAFVCPCDASDSRDSNASDVPGCRPTADGSSHWRGPHVFEPALDYVCWHWPQDVPGSTLPLPQFIASGWRQSNEACGCETVRAVVESVPVLSQGWPHAEGVVSREWLHDVPRDISVVWRVLPQGFAPGLPVFAHDRPHDACPATRVAWPGCGRHFAVDRCVIAPEVQHDASVTMRVYRHSALHDSVCNILDNNQDERVGSWSWTPPSRGWMVFRALRWASTKDLTSDDQSLPG